MKDRTKYLFANTLIEMLKDTTFDKIRVTGLAKRAGTTAQTFYYHFKDKYELVAWMYLKDFSDVVSYQEKEYSPARLAAILDKMNDKKSFYKKVFASDSQNSITSYIRILSIKLAKDALIAAGHSEVLTDEEELSIKYHAYGIDGLLQEWVLAKDPMETLALADFMYRKTPDYLKESFEKLEYAQEGLMKSKL